MVLICSFLLSFGAVSCTCATPNFVVWCQDRIRKSTFHRLLWHVWKNLCHFRCVQEGPGTHSLGSFFCSLVRIFGTSLAQIFCMPSSKVKISWTVWRFKSKTLLIILTVKRRSDLTRSLTLVTFSSVFECKVFQNEVRLPHSHGHPKVLYAT